MRRSQQLITQLHSHGGQIVDDFGLSNYELTLVTLSGRPLMWECKSFDDMLKKLREQGYNVVANTVRDLGTKEGSIKFRGETIQWEAVSPF